MSRTKTSEEVSEDAEEGLYGDRVAEERKGVKRGEETMVLRRVTVQEWEMTQRGAFDEVPFG